MKKTAFYTIILFISLVCWNCSKSDDAAPENKEFIDPNAFYVDQDHSEANDNNDGRYKEDGGTGPWKTIQKMLNTLEAGEVGYVRASNSTYIPTEITNAFDFTAFFIHKSGAPGNPIIISGYPGERPKIGFSTFEEAIKHTKFAGFSTDFTTSYVTIRNFEIANLTGSGIFVNPDTDPPNVGLIFEKLYIHDLLGIDNTGGIRLDGCNDCIVRNNIIHDIYNTHSDHNPFTNMPYGLHAGIHGYQPANCIIENNLIYNVDQAVFQKHSDQQHGKSHVVRNNIIYNIERAALGIHGGPAGPRHAEFYNNIVYDTGIAVWMPLQDVAEQGDGIKIYNNTIVDTESLAYIEEVLNIEVFNNIVSGIKPSWSSNTNETIIFSTGPTIDIREFKNSITYFDNNLYHDQFEHWMLERGGSQVKNIYEFSNWQNTIEPSLGLDFKPDQTSQVTNPLFTNPDNRDYTLKAGSPALSGGRGGDYPTILGAVRSGVDIGPDWRIE